MKKYYFFGFISGILCTVFLMSFGFSRYYVFVGPIEAHVNVDGRLQGFKIDQISEVNDFLKNLPGGRKAFIYPTSNSSYTIVYLPRKNRNVDEAEQAKMSKIINEKINGIRAGRSR
jgi:hypothetical protein